MYLKQILKKYVHRGTLFIEYAVLLAFIIGIGAIFLSSNGITDSLTSIFNKADKTIELAVNNNKTEPKNILEGAIICKNILVGDPNKSYSIEDYKNRRSIQGEGSDGHGSALISLEANSTYTITVDLAKLQELGFPLSSNSKEYSTGLTILGYAESNSKGLAVLDTGTKNLLQASTGSPVTFSNSRPSTEYDSNYRISYNNTGDSATFTFDTGSSPLYLGFNFNGYTNNGPDTTKSTVNKAFNDGIAKLQNPSPGYALTDIMKLQKNN